MSDPLKHTKRIRSLIVEGKIDEATATHNRKVKADIGRAKAGEVIEISDLMAAKEVLAEATRETGRQPVSEPEESDDLTGWFEAYDEAHAKERASAWVKSEPNVASAEIGEPIVIRKGHREHNLKGVYQVPISGTLRTNQNADPKEQGHDSLGTGKLKVIVVVEGGIADVAYNEGPDQVDVEIVDLDGLEWLTRDERYELWERLESGDAELANVALHLHGYHGWQDPLTDASALPTLHAELHEQTECDHTTGELFS